MRKYISLLYLVTLCALASAQPGYMGKRFSVGYHFECTPVPSMLTSIDEYDTKSVQPREYGVYQQGTVLNFVTGHSFQFGCAVSRKGTLFGHVGIRNRKIFLQPGTYADPGVGPNGYYQEVDVDPIDRILDAREFVYDIGYRKYLTEYIAPIGAFLQFGIGRSELHYTDTKIPVRVLADRVETTISSDNTSQKMTRLNFGLGVMRTIYKSVYFSASGELFLNFPEGGSLSDGDFEYGDYRYKYLKNSLGENSGIYSWMAVRFGVGVMI